MTSRNVTKVLAGMEDLLTGVGTATQDRNGTSMPITKIDIAFAVATTAAMQALDVTKYTRARVYASESNVVEYLYDSTSNAGLASDTGPGSWLLTAESTKVLGVEDKISLRLTEPSFALQLAVALGGASLGVGYGGVYWYDENDTTTVDNGDSVFVTTGGARWKKVTLEALETPQLYTAGGTANALTASFGLSAIPADKLFWLKASLTNSGSMTLDLDGTGVLPIQYTDGSAVTAGTCELGKAYAFIKVGSTYRIINPSVSAAAVTAGTDNFGTITPLRLATYLLPYWTILSQATADIGTLQAGVANVTYLLDSNSYSQLNLQSFTSSGTYTTPTGVLYDPHDTVVIRGVAPGGGGGGGYNGSSFSGGGGGGGGGFFEDTIPYADCPASLTVVVGAAGVKGVFAGSTDGTPGGATYVYGSGVFIGARGGYGGKGAPSSSTGGDGGIGGKVLLSSTDDVDLPIFNGADGGAGSGSVTGAATKGSSAMWGGGGGGGGGSGSYNTGATGGLAKNNGAGGRGSDKTGLVTGAVGASYGGGGGGGGASTDGFDGAPGRVDIFVVRGRYKSIISNVL